jgi:hypothetical protein
MGRAKRGRQLVGIFNIVAYLLKARPVQPQKQLLPANRSETTFISWQRARKNNGTSIARQQILNKQQLKKNK